MMKSVPETLDVYRCGTDYALPPDDRIPFEEGLRRIEAGTATFCKHNRAIRMKKCAPSTRRLQAGSAECNRRFVETWSGSREAQSGSQSSS